MGTSALDGAKLGIPTVLIDGSYDRFPAAYRYRWIYETGQLNLGRIIRGDTKHFDGKHTFGDIVECIYTNKKLVAKKCREYVVSNYNVDIAIKKIMASRICSPIFSYINTTKY